MNDEEVEDYKRRSRVHHKIHRTNRIESMKRKAAAPGDKTSTVHSIDMTPPILVPSCRRSIHDFRGKFVVRLLLGIESSYSTEKTFVFAYGESIAHGQNSNITVLYHILRWELWRPQTTAAFRLFLEFDGAGDNTGFANFGFLNHIILEGWRSQIETHRNLPHHGYSSDDQKFRVIRRGLRSSLTTGSIAHALAKVLCAFKTKKDSYVLLVLTTNYDWERFYAGLMNKYFKNYNRPLSWRFKASERPGGLPRAWNKMWGDAQQEWHGIDDTPDGDPIQAMVRAPGKYNFII